MIPCLHWSAACHGTEVAVLRLFPAVRTGPDAVAAPGIFKRKPTSGRVRPADGLHFWRGRWHSTHEGYFVA
jgi:hypothetical protein